MAARGSKSRRSITGVQHSASNYLASAKRRRDCRAQSRRCSQLWRSHGWHGGSTAARQRDGCCFLLPSSAAMIGFSHSAATDMPFSAMLTCAVVPAAVLLGMVPFARAERQSADRDFAAELSKSAKRIAAASVRTFSWATQCWRKVRQPSFCPVARLFAGRPTQSDGRHTVRLLHPVAIAVFCIVALPWYVLCAVRNPDFLRVFILEHNFKRFLTPEFQHIQPFWYYAGIVLIALLPWTPALLWAIVTGIRSLIRGQRLSAMSCFLLSWSAFCLVFFAISRSKLPGYILPAIPAIGFLLARAITKFGAMRRWSFSITSLLPGIALAVLFLRCSATTIKSSRKPWRTLPPLSSRSWPSAQPTYFLAFFYLFPRRNFAMIAAVVPVLFVMYIVDDALPFTPISTQSARYLADQIRADEIPPSQSPRRRPQTRYSLRFEFLSAHRSARPDRNPHARHLRSDNRPHHLRQNARRGEMRRRVATHRRRRRRRTATSDTYAIREIASGKQPLRRSAGA